MPTVLVVDDDADVLAVASASLSLDGYAVLEAADAATALEILKSNPDIDILFTDIVMPGGMDGFELAYHARRLYPGLRVLYTSGYIKASAWEQEGTGYGAMLRKPWRPSQLRQTIQDLLSGRQTA